MTPKFDKTALLAWVGKLRGHSHLCLGLDQGSSALRYVLVDTRHQVILDWGTYGFEGARQGGERRKASFVFKEIAKNLPVRRIGVVNVNIQDPALAIGRFHIPQVDKNEQDNLIRMALRGQLPFRVEDAVYYCREYVKKNADPPKGNEDEKSAKLFFNFMAIDKKILSDLMEPVVDHLRVLPHMTIQGYAHEHLVQVFRLASGDETIAFLNIGRGFTVISIFQKGQIIFQRNIPLAGQDITRSIFVMYRDERSMEKILSLDEAEQLKRRHTLPLKEDKTESDEGTLDEKLFQCIQGVLAAWIQDVRLTFHYYYQHYEAKTVSKIYVLGGSAHLRNLIPYIREQLEIETRALSFPENSPVRITSEREAVTFKENFCEYATALGYALHTRQDASLNLHGVQSVDYLSFLGPVFRIFYVFITAVLLTWYGFLHTQHHYVHDVYAAIHSHNRFLKEIESPYLEMVKWRQFVQGMDMEVPRASAVLKILTRAVSYKLLLQEVSIQRAEGSLVIDGVIFGDPRNRAVTIADFSKLLKDSNLFSQIEVPRMDAVSDRPDEAFFSLRARLVKSSVR